MAFAVFSLSAPTIVFRERVLPKSDVKFVTLEVSHAETSRLVSERQLEKTSERFVTLLVTMFS